MIYEEERTVDEMVDDILGDETVRETASRASRLDANFRPDTPAVDIPDPARPDENGVRSTRTPSTGGAQVRPDERATCRRCGKIFARQAGSTRTLCQECFAASHRRKQPPANGQQVKTGNDQEGKEAETVQKAETDTQKQWDALDESAPAANETPPPERRPEDMSTGGLVDELADGMRAEPGDVALALYQAARDVARAAGIQTRILIETMYEIDQVLSHVGGV